MDEAHTPKQFLFSELLQRWPVKKRWCNVVVGDLHAILLGMGGFSYDRTVSSGCKYVPVLLTFLHRTEGNVANN